ncbi:MAG TPA: D-alanyl-D-alanine carboxypeptidase/D-alanyl-D-alanine-endopeptidase [Bacteroidales bacterium]|nr:D-alanyl-D-alanine carboxypeptidase/D-alanyl-D-alanine-endopeptidase [Bacteroidales bacterium]
MNKFLKAFLLLLLPGISNAQNIDVFTCDTAMTNASVSVCILDAVTGGPVFEYDSGRSLKPASIMKLITSASALELLGSGYTFSTTISYSGVIKKSGKLEGDIIIKGGGDPAFASENFPEYYRQFPSGWIDEVKKLGIKKINGRIITDDSYFDYHPIPSGWLWEDAGNYYGAGVYGAAIYDNTYRIHFNTMSGDTPVITFIDPVECNYNLVNNLKTSGVKDEGYVYSIPYSVGGWIAGTIPGKREDFVLRASIPDPPLIMAKIVDRELRAAGIEITSLPSTYRLLDRSFENIIEISKIKSPPLSEIIEMLNHESVNLYAETLVKEIGKKFGGEGSTEAGLNVVREFLTTRGIDTKGMYIEDGSGLSPVNALNSKNMASLLLYMKTSGKFFDIFLNSFPEAGNEGTLKNRFTDEVFKTHLKTKSGSMTRVRCYAGYVTTNSGRDLVFCIMANNFSGSSGSVIPLFETFLKDLIISY